MTKSQSRIRGRFALMPLEGRFWAKVDVRGPDECWPWLASLHEQGYGQFEFAGKTRKAHRVAWLLTYGSISDSVTKVCHRCDNPWCVNPAHLFIGTQRDNMTDCRAKARHHHGQTHRSAKLTEAQVLEIRASRERTYILAERYAVDSDTIRQARLGQTWKHLT